MRQDVNELFDRIENQDYGSASYILPEFEWETGQREARRVSRKDNEIKV